MIRPILCHFVKMILRRDVSIVDWPTVENFGEETGQTEDNICRTNCRTICSLDPRGRTRSRYTGSGNCAFERGRSVRKQRSSRVTIPPSILGRLVDEGEVFVFWFGRRGWPHRGTSHHGGAWGMQGIRDLFLVFACLHFLAICVSGNAIDAPTTLSRRKRYLIFPEGSNMQVGGGKILYFNTIW